MDKFKLIIASAGFIAVVISMFECLYPAEKFNKQLNYIFSLILILTVTESFFRGDINFIQTVNKMDISSKQMSDNSDDVWGYFKTSVENNISTNISKHLEENKIMTAEIKTSINISDSGSISINEIEITVEEAVQEGEIIALIKEYTNQDISVKIKEVTEHEY